MSEMEPPMVVGVEELHRRAALMPFPLASVIDLYLTDTDDRDRIEDLRHTFEATAEFAATVLLAGLMADDRLFAAVKRSIQGPGRGVSHALRTASLGAWNLFGSSMALAIRKRVEKGEGDQIAQAFGLDQLDPLDALIDPAFWRILGDALTIRNRVHGHDPKLSRADRAEALLAFERLLARLLPLLEQAFVGWSLVRLGSAQIQDGVLVYDARQLRGAPRRFRPVLLPLRHVLDSDAIYLYANGARRPLRLAPFVRIVNDAEREAEACYFYDRIENEEMRWKLFHTGADAELSIMVPEVTRVLNALTMPPPAEGDGTVVLPAVPPEPTHDARPAPGQLPAVAVGGKLPSGALVGMPLADAMYLIRGDVDPDRHGFPLDSWLHAATAAGILIRGDQGQKLRSAFNIAHHRFARVGRGIWTWVPADPTVDGHRLSGAALRDVAYEVARVLDPQRVGLHYEDLKAELLRRDVPIAGPSQGRQVWSAIGSRSARSRFVALGKGRFVWASEPEQERVDRAMPERLGLALPAALMQFSKSFDNLDMALLAVSPSIGRLMVGDEVVYTTGSEPIARVGTMRSRLQFTIAQTIDTVPHLRGLVLHRLALAGQPGAETESWLTVDGPRAVDGAAYLLAARHAASEHPYLSEPFLHFTEGVRTRGGLFDQGWGDGDRPPVRMSTAELQDFWRGLVEQHPWVASVTRKVVPKRPRLGSSGSGGVYRTIRLDRFGVLVTCWFGSESGFAAGADDVEQRASDAEGRIGHPLTVHEREGRAWLADRVATGDAADRETWPRLWTAAADGLRELLVALAQPT